MPRHPADGCGQMGSGFLLRRIAVVSNPGNVLSNVGHLHQEAIEARALRRTTEREFVQIGGTGGDDDPVQIEFLDVPFHKFLTGIGAHVFVIACEHHVGLARGKARQGFHIHGAGDIAAAMAYVDPDPQCFIPCDHD